MKRNEIIIGVQLTGHSRDSRACVFSVCQLVFNKARVTRTGDVILRALLLRTIPNVVLRNVLNSIDRIKCHVALTVAVSVVVVVHFVLGKFSSAILFDQINFDV